MIIQSLNIGPAKTIKWRGKSIKTGIYKKPVDQPIYLGTKDVKDDIVVDRKYHGGIDKACYAYSTEAYLYWHRLYPDHDFTLGFFGENLTIKGLNESKIRIGNQYKIGNVIIEASQPREPCFKLGIRFGAQTILKAFINAPHPGVYFRVLKEGTVSNNDTLELILEDKMEPTVLEVYKMIVGLEKNPALIQSAIHSVKLSESAKKSMMKQSKKALNF